MSRSRSRPFRHSDNAHYVNPEDELREEPVFASPPRKYEQTETAVVVMRHLRRLARSQSGRSTEAWVDRVHVDGTVTRHPMTRQWIRPTEVWRTRWENYEVDVVDTLTGEVVTEWAQTRRKRKVRRRFSYLRNQTHGFLAVNDGARAAHDIARLLGGDPPLRRTDVRLVA